MARPAQIVVVGARLRRARRELGLSQVELARATNIHRLRLLRIESGQAAPLLDEVVRLASVLKLPLAWFVTGKMAPSADLKGIAIELFHLGVRDLEVAEPDVPGSFRRPEEVMVAAIKGDRPEPRVIEAIPFALSRQPLDVSLVLAFADWYDPRARTRLAWLSEIASQLVLQGIITEPFSARTKNHLDVLARAVPRPKEPDSLGHPLLEGSLSPIWKRWKITYSGTLKDFTARTLLLQTALLLSAAPLPEAGE